MIDNAQSMRLDIKGVGLVVHRGRIVQRMGRIARGIEAAHGPALYHEYGHLQLNNAREIKHKAASHSTSSNAGNVTTSDANNDGNTGSDGDGGDDGGDGSGEDGDDDPSDIAQSLRSVYHLTFPSHFLSCLLLSVMCWIFRDSLLAVMPLTGLCALCAFPDKLQLLKGEVSSQGAKFAIRGKK